MNSLIQAPKVDTVEDIQDQKSALGLECLKLTAEDLTQEFDWTQQLRQQKFYANHTNGWIRCIRL